MNGLTPQLLTANPNGVNPRRYDPTAVGDILTCDQDHNYTDEQVAFDNGAMDKFPATVGTGTGTSPTGAPCVAGDVMNYYDGNTVTALWNYAQRYAMSDNSFGTTFGPSSPGAVNLVSGDTGDVDMAHVANGPSIATPAAPNADLTPDGHGGFSLTSDAQPYWDDCSTRDAVAMTGTEHRRRAQRRGRVLGLVRGWLPAHHELHRRIDRSRPTRPVHRHVHPRRVQERRLSELGPPLHEPGHLQRRPPGRSRVGGTGQYGYKDDYIPHHEPFQYYATTANPHHVTLPTAADGSDTPAALATIGTDTQHYVNDVPQFDTPNHQYDTSDFDQLVAAIGHGTMPASALPAVSFLKAPGYQDGHAAYSNPLDEQRFVTQEINALMRTPDWPTTAVIVSYDDSDGWYDHVYSGVTNPSQSVADALTGPGKCGTAATQLAAQQGRCGYGPRLPLLVISPWAKFDYVDHTRTDQSSIIRFVEDNWHVPRIPGSFDNVAGPLDNMFDFRGFFGFPLNFPPMFLDPTTGQISLR